MLTEQPNLLQHRDASGRRAVHYAAASGHMEFVRDAVTANPELVTMEDDSGWTLLLISASSGHPEIVRFLLTNPRTNVNPRFPFTYRLIYN